MPPREELKSYTRDEVAKHKAKDDLWTIVDSVVYRLDAFLDMHPGGTAVLLDDDVAGKDSTEMFFGLHRADILLKYQRLAIGRIEGEEPKYLRPSPGALSPVPYAEPPWLVPEFHSPYFNDSHRALQKEVRRFFDTYVKDDAAEKELSAEPPSNELMELMGSPEWNLNAMRLGPGKHLHGLTLPGGMRGEDFDYFHELVVLQELTRLAAPGYMAGLQAGLVIGAPPILNYGDAKLQAEVLPDLMAGKKFIALAISEAQAGSDVQGMHTRAEKVTEGGESFYIVTGAKKWITQGQRADWFMTGVRTGDRGSLSMLLIPRTDAVETKRIKTSYSGAAGTAYVLFDRAKVPARYLLGEEGGGTRVILSNFNHERFVICCRIVRYSRLIVEEVFKWSHLRKVFGKSLISQPVVRQKIAAMFAKVEAGQAWLEDIAYQMCKMSYQEQSVRLAGRVAALKYYLSHTAGEISDDAVQIFGGRGITSTGMGRLIEQFQRTYAFDKILGGSEEILADLAVRQAMKHMPRTAL